VSYFDGSVVGRHSDLSTIGKLISFAMKVVGVLSIVQIARHVSCCIIIVPTPASNHNTCKEGSEWIADSKMQPVCTYFVTEQLQHATIMRRQCHKQ
jgi:hypothetical protein